MSGLGLLFAALTLTFSCYASPTQSKDFCKTPPLLQNAYLEGGWNNETYAPGHVIKYICFPGYTSFGPITMVCNESKWIMKLQKTCKKKSCGHPGGISFGSFVLKSGEGFEFGAIIEYSCEDGYQMVSRHKIRECTASGWTKAVPICEARLCPPVVDKSLRVLSAVSDDEYTSGQVIRLQCKNPNHVLDGPSEIFCTSNGTWDTDPPTCKVTGPCIVQKDNMTHHNIKLKNCRRHYIAHNEVMEFECLPGYVISDPKTLRITCNGEAFTYPTCHSVFPRLDVQETRQKSPCHDPPAVAFGESLGEKKQVYDSGSKLEIQCMNFYKLQGKRFIKCQNGVWEDPPICLEPCVLNNNYIQGNNTRLANGNKRYLKHGEGVLLKCLPKFKISDRTLLKVKCTEGKLLYPKCVKPGPCVVNENVIKENHIVVINENCHGMPKKCRSKPFWHNQAVKFTCLPGYNIPDPKQLNAICFGGAINYPKCFNTIL